MAEPAASARVSSRSPRVNPSDSPIPLTRPGTPSPDGRSRIRTTGGSGWDRPFARCSRMPVSPPLTWRESAATPRVAPWSRWTTRATRSCRVSCGWTCAPRSRPSRCSPPATSRSASTATEPGPSAPSGWSRRRSGSSRTGPSSSPAPRRCASTRITSTSSSPGGTARPRTTSRCDGTSSTANPRRPCSRSSACRSSRRSGRRTSCRWATRWRRCRRRPRRTWASTPAFRWRRAAPTPSSRWSASGPFDPVNSRSSPAPLTSTSG
mmetsp:Transcript_4350/g.19467  ORF Transcript_4350/g.19467 Transcript_4350/m.19467 type:complete len:265 (-) Transcript_4350:1540-2334(-)